ncbi:hypothetical protein AN963_11440 [Brevibacillus choshinensis]|uniref:Uncharacterized protein n=1 Tax=Brevibacillus choshinensis TaxID=54911 RepID=A0ABR5N4V9_BRECH|nr:hypothetical protein AN963_11440 [Brevibacillus choshinensis]
MATQDYALRQELRDQGALRTIGAQRREWISSHFDIVQKGQEILDLYECVKKGKEGGEDQ